MRANSVAKSSALTFTKLSFWNKEKWNEYAKKGAAFIMLASETPGLMKDIDPKKLSDNIKSIKYSSNGGSFIEIYFDKLYIFEVNVNV